MDVDDAHEAGRALAKLASPVAFSWPDAREIRRRASRRRRARRTGGVAVVLVAAVAAAAVLVPSHTAPQVTAALVDGTRVAGHIGAATQLVSARTRQAPASPDFVAASPEQASAAEAEQRFSVDLLRQLTNGSTSSNVVVSPQSLMTALAMLELGARSTTKDQIAAALAASNLSPDQLGSGLQALTADLAQAAKSHGVTFQSANSLWLQHGQPMVPKFLDDLSRYFATGVWQVDFAHDANQAADALNAWVKDQTHGHISQLFSPGDLASTVAVLANAVYFKAAWQWPFTGTTANGSFATSSGASVSVPFLHSGQGEPLQVQATTDNGVDAVELPYQGGRFSALVVMPTAGTLAAYVDKLTPASLAATVDSLQHTAVELAMPKLHLTDNQDLDAPLRALGMTDAFTASADLSGMTTTPVAVSKVVQKATLDVTEYGTEASAATGVAIGDSAVAAPPLSMTFDHPYLFLIRDTQTGAILFSSAVGDPSAS